MTDRTGDAREAACHNSSSDCAGAAGFDSSNSEKEATIPYGDESRTNILLYVGSLLLELFAHLLNLTLEIPFHWEQLLASKLVIIGLHRPVISSESQVLGESIVDGSPLTEDGASLAAASSIGQAAFSPILLVRVVRFDPFYPGTLLVDSRAPYQLALPTSMPMPGKHVEKKVEKAGAVFIQLEISLEGIIGSQSRMPQLDKFTYFTQFFWSCLFLFTFYIAICNDGDGVLGISRILKLRNQLVSHRETNIRSNDPKSLEDILRKGFSTGVSYMYGSLFEVSQWCNAVDLLGKRKKITLISCFGELSGSRGMERNIFYLISKSSYSTSSNPGWGITCRNDIMLMHVLHGQGSIGF
ncbi:hypothetical protein BUALT_BualtMtG0007400 (mitochondrion) [Buddleja alternifolia]|uniref:H(+)-transporting two-sector ATPase n=1 Tax=Buddleja alternifolia TaxID=168488 RepID=A0AAV6W1M4_9LAMI|nr:hypothetical protein BUALT_BualtMtG0007400 [Buddleja alternifolia]